MRQQQPQPQPVNANMPPPSAPSPLISHSQNLNTYYQQKLFANQQLQQQHMKASNARDPNENYDLSDLNSEDSTDDDEEPSKPIPAWARDSQLRRTAEKQCVSLLNYTKLFRASSQAEIVLEDIFKTRRKKFTERTSSANWTCPPVWASSGISGTGDESFWQSHR